MPLSSSPSREMISGWATPSRSILLILSRMALGTRAILPRGLRIQWELDGSAAGERGLEATGASEMELTGVAAAVFGSGGGTAVRGLGLHKGSSAVVMQISFLNLP